MDDVGAVNERSVPCMCGNMDSFDCDFGVAKAFSSGDSGSFVEEAEEPFNGDRLVDVEETLLEGQFEGIAHSFQMAVEGGACIWGCKGTETNPQENMCHEGRSKRGGIEFRKFGNKGQSCDVAHGTKNAF